MNESFDLTSSLAGRCAVVTGAGDGIGRGIALRLAKEGAAVIVAELDPDAGARVVEEIRSIKGNATFLATDVTDKASVRAMMDAAGAVDIVVNNAWAGGGVGRIERKADADFERAFHMGPMACQWTMQAAFPHMQAQGWGRVINMASLNGVNAHMGSADYNMAKEAIRSLTRTAAREWARYGITCNIICPAAVSAAMRRMMEQQPGVIEHIAAANPMGRMGDPERDIAGVVAFLCSEDASYMTGNTLFVDGGGHINGVAWAPDLGE